MAAVRAERLRDKPLHGRGHDLLCLWAQWYRGGLPGDNCEWSVQERTDKAQPGQPPDEAQRVERILRELFSSHPQYRSMVKRHYLDELALWDIAQKLKYTPGFVRMSLQAVCDWVERRFE